MKRILTFILLCLLFANCIAQTRKIDSLKQRISATPSKPVKLKLLLALCDEHESLSTDSAWNYAVRARSLAVHLHDGISLSWAKMAQASAYLQWNNPDSARALIKPEIAKYNVENAATRRLYFSLLQKEIDCNDQDSHFKEGFAKVYHIMRLAEKYKDSVVIAESMNTLGAWNYDMDFVDRSIAWEYRGIAYCSIKNPKFYEALAGLYLNLAGNYNWIHKRDSAAYFTRKSIRLSEQTQNLFMLAYAWETIANTYKAQKDYVKAEQALSKSLEVTRRVYGDVPQQRQILTLASIYRLSGRSSKAIQILRAGLIADSLYNYHSAHSPAKVAPKDLQLIFYYEELARNYRIQHDYKNLSAVLTRVIKGKDSLYAANSTQAMADMGVKYESQKKESTIALQRLELTKENYLFYGSILLSLLTGTIFWLLFREYRRRQRLVAALAVTNAEETERRRIAADLHDNLGAQLSFIKRNVEFLLDQPEGFELSDEQRYLDNLNDIAKSAMIDLRETIWVLNKEEVFIQEFTDKLKYYLRQQLTGRDKITWSLNEEVAVNWKLSSSDVMHLFRIVQELVSNTIKHAAASKIDIEFTSREPDTFYLKICDNGKGFDLTEKRIGHYGLANIKQRAKELKAVLTIESNQHGTSNYLEKAIN